MSKVILARVLQYGQDVVDLAEVWRTAPVAVLNSQPYYSQTL